MRNRGWLIRRTLLAADLLTLALPLVLALSGRWTGLDATFAARLASFAPVLPAWVLAAKAYRLYDRDESPTSHSTIDELPRLFNLLTPPTEPFTPAGKAVGIVLVKSDLNPNLKLDSRFMVRPVTSSQVFDATALRSAFVEGIVIDLDRESIAVISSLRQVFPELRIVALSSSATKAAYARRAGASIVITKPTSAGLVGALVQQLIWG